MMEAANDNARRPAEFDARVMAYRPGMMKRAKYFTTNIEDRDDLVTDTIMKCLSNWRLYRDDAGSIWNWIYLTMRGIVSHRRTALARQVRTVEDPNGYFASRVQVAATQIEHMAFVETVEFVSKTKAGKLLVRHAMGDDLGQIASERGLTKQRIHQIVDRERKRLVRLRKAA